MDFELPAELTGYLAELDDFIEREIQMRRVAGYMFGFMSQSEPKGVDGTAERLSGSGR